MSKSKVLCFVLSAVVCASMVVAAWAGEVRTMTPGGDPPAPSGDKEEPVETASNPCSGCEFEGSNSAYLTCVEDSYDPQYLVDWVPGGSGYIGVDLLKSTGEEIDDVCVKENDPDIQWTSIKVDRTGLVAKIGKFTVQSNGPGGTVYVYVNEVAVSFSTRASDSVQTLNDKLGNAITEKFPRVEAGNYYVVTGDGLGGTPTKLGFRSTDAGLWQSAIALEPYNLVGVTDCDASCPQP